MTRKISEVTIAEFLKKAKEKDNNHILEDERFGFLNVLKQEGFTEEESLQMNMKKGWEFYINWLINNPSKVTHHFYFASKIDAENAPVMRSYLKQIIELYKKIEKDFNYENSSTKNNDE